MDHQTFADDLSHRASRIQRRVRVLENNLHIPAQFFHGLRIQGQDVSPFKMDLTLGGFFQP